MKRGREFPSVTSGQLHSMSPIPSPTLSAPSPRVNEGMSQGTPACLVVVHRHQLLNVGEVGHVESVWRRVLGPGLGRETIGAYPGGRVWRSFFHCCHSIDEDWNDQFDLDYTRHEDVRMVVETMMTARRTHRNRMHAYFKKFPSKEAALLKPHPDTTEEQWKELCDLFTSEAFMKRSEQNKKNRSKLTVNHAAGSRSFQRTSLHGKTYTEIEVYSEILGKKSGYVRGLGRAVKPPPSSTLTTQSSDLQHQLAKARDEIEAMRAAREKDLQEFAKKQAEMEATLRDHREEQRVEQERIRLEQEERMKRGAERMRKEQERLRAEISKELEKKMSSVMEKKMSDMSKRLFSQFGGSKR
ncbi:hypothetical protein CJ030_MR7G012942 [Morella rubra]|uniref:Uncharacterized protein n=1 Tax=Morella rubra TaxID=262757 RepID=A0A6A1V698_9ROSI|nr:hypothetical protein CJ030_MR7G012942 [Morella rubra]